MPEQQFTQQLIGKILDYGVCRDAIHVAVLPVSNSGESALAPGQHITLIDGSDCLAAGVYEVKNSMGIVDPFLISDVEVGERFFMFLRPSTVTGMRHHWEHPKVVPALNSTVLPDKTKEQARQWIAAYAERAGFKLDELIDGAQYFASEITVHGREQFDIDSNDLDEFWNHLEILTGKTFDSGHRGQVEFNCSC